jgi:hypothetical protein
MLSTSYAFNKVFLILILFSFNFHFLNFLPMNTLRYSITMMPILLLSLYGMIHVVLCILRENMVPKIVFIMILILIIFFLLNSIILRKDMSRILEVGAFYLPLIGFYFLSKKNPISEKILIQFLVFIIIPITIIFSLMEVHSFRYMISYMGDGRLLIFFGAIHLTGIILLFLFTSMLSLYIYKNKIVYFYILIFILLLILTSGSRTAFLIALFLFIMGYGIKKRYIVNNAYLFLLPLILLFSIYIIDFLREYLILIGLGEQLKLNNVNVTAGRAWLWLYHMDLFFENLFIGTDDSLLDISKGDYTYTGEISQAGTESYYTKLLARDGIWGFIHIGFYLYLLYLAIKSKNNFAYFLIVIIIISNATVSQFSNMYELSSFLGYWMLFSLLFNNADVKIKKL